MGSNLSFSGSVLCYFSLSQIPNKVGDPLSTSSSGVGPLPVVNGVNVM